MKLQQKYVVTGADQAVPDVPLDMEWKLVNISFSRGLFMYAMKTPYGEDITQYGFFDEFNTEEERKFCFDLMWEAVPDEE